MVGGITIKLIEPAGHHHLLLVAARQRADVVTVRLTDNAQGFDHRVGGRFHAARPQQRKGSMTLEEREHTTDLLKEAAKTRAVVVVEHDMEFVRRLDCKVTVLHEGSVLAEGSLDHVTKNQDVIDVYLGR